MHQPRKEGAFFMVKVRGIEGVLIKADSYSELLKAINNEVSNYEGYEPSMTIIDEHRAIVYHSEIVDELAEPNPWDGRYCCECGNYKWGRGCCFKEGHITLKMEACHNFTIEIGGDE